MSEKSPRGPTRGAEPPPTPVTGELVRSVYVGRLETVADWRKQIGKIFREMRKGQLAHEDGTRLTYVANIGAQLAKVEDELREAQALRDEIQRLQMARVEVQRAAPALTGPQASVLAAPAPPAPSWVLPKPGDPDYVAPGDH